MIYTYGNVFSEKEIKNLFATHFWTKVLQYVHFIYKSSTIKSLEPLLAMPIWYSIQIIEGKIQSWVDKGLRSIGDLLDTEGQMYPIEYIQNVLELKCGFFCTTN